MISHSIQKNHTNTASQERYSLLRSQAHAFCQALLSPPPPEELVKEFFIPEANGKNPTIREHGPSWATVYLPFLGRDFVGFHSSIEYFELLSRTLKMHLDKDSFPGEDGFVVDADANRVAVVGKGKFESVETGRSWDEKFSYVLSGWDEEGKLGRWDIWADPLSAWAAVSDEDINGWHKGEHRSLMSVVQHMRA
ncbi:hypothetical protein E8E14_002134 [Neopestalotiopsis sp. 37M]|nr:hypothetical protein E8E14_002134 [Neopestalotiopsis sp. 37M]